MAFLTFAAGTLISSTRINAVKTGIVYMEYYEIFQGRVPPADVIKTTRHLSNLSEAPILSMTHLKYNRACHSLYDFLTSQVVLIATRVLVFLNVV